MIRQVLPSDREGLAQFKFYTYDPTGCDVIIPVWAVDEDAAWVKFDGVYGKETAVDQVIRG
jgi:hypothetical protein